MRIGYCDFCPRERKLNVTEYAHAQYWKAVEQASLLPDLQLLADGDLTEVCFSFLPRIYSLNSFCRSVKKVST